MAEHGDAKQRPGVAEPQDIPFKFKAEVGNFEWGGMWPDGDTSAVPPNRPRLLLNTRLRNGEIRRRPGQQRLDDSALGGSVIGLNDFKIARPYSLYYIQDGCPGISSTVGFSIGSFDYEQFPYAQPLTYNSGLSSNFVIGAYSDTLYGVKDSSLIQLQLFRAPFGGATLSAAGTSLDIQLFDLPTLYGGASLLQSFDGKLFIAATNGGASSFLTFDGTTLAIDKTGIPAPTGGGVFRETLVIGYADSVNAVSVRQTDGTWADVAPSSGTVAMRGPHTTVSYRDTFYFAGDTSDIWSFDGTALTAIGTGLSGLNALAKVKDVCKHDDGLMYVLWEYADHSAAGILSYDGTTWTPIAKDLKAQFATLNGAFNIRSFCGVLFVAASDSTYGGVWLTSPELDPGGTYVRHTLSNPSGQFFDVVTF
jgi:hypothetical protein